MKTLALGSVFLLALVLGCNALPTPTATDELGSNANGEITAQVTLETVNATTVDAARLEDEGMLLEAVGRTAGGKAFSALLIVAADSVSGWQGASVQVRARRVVTGGVPALVGTAQRSNVTAGFVLVDPQNRIQGSAVIGSSLEFTDVLVSSFSFGASNPSILVQSESGLPFTVGTGLLSPRPEGRSVRLEAIPDGTSNTLSGRVRVLETNVGMVGRIAGSLGGSDPQGIIAILIGL